MNSNVFTQVLVSVLALSSAIGFSADAQAQSQTTAFRCVAQGQNYATVARRGDRTTPPIIVWKTKEFGAEYTPQQRCRVVSERLTKAVSDNGGRLTNLQLTSGSVNRQSVICYVNNYSRCNARNTLFTLDRNNANNPDEVLDRLLNFGSNGSGDPVVSIAKPEETPQSQQPYVSLEDVVNQAFAAGSGGRPVPQPGDNSI